MGKLSFKEVKSLFPGVIYLRNNLIIWSQVVLASLGWFPRDFPFVVLNVLLPGKLFSLGCWAVATLVNCPVFLGCLCCAHVILAV
jgi:hypothetical protein